ncbi:MAG: hypothetical protein GX352_10170 [Clostridiales bacterium]|nr:hypothetical protein [Clostridiales bacterium]
MLKSMLRPVVSLWERFFIWAYKVTPIEGSPHGLLRISAHPYKGKPETLSDGTRVLPGDYVLELHISNMIIYTGNGADRKVISGHEFLGPFRQEIANLAHLARLGRLDSRVKAVWGVTMLGAGLKRLGFELKPMEAGFCTKCLILWMNFLKWLYSPTQRSSAGKSKNPRRQGYQYWLSIEQLIEKYQK